MGSRTPEYEALQAVRRVEILRLEALSARLPSYIGAEFVLRRCQLFTKLRRPLRLITDWTFLLPLTLWYRTRQVEMNLNRSLHRQHRRERLRLAIELILPLNLITIGFTGPLVGSPDNTVETGDFLNVMSVHPYLVFGLLLAYVFVATASMTLYSFLSVGCRLNLAYIFERLNGAGWTRIIKRSIGWTLSLCMVILACIAPGALAHGVGWLLGYRDFGFPLYVGSLIAVTIGGSIVGLVIEYFERRRFRDRLRTLNSQAFGSALVLQAQSLEELEYWLDNDEDLWEGDVSRIRSFMRLLGSPNPYKADHSIFGLPLFRLNWSERTTHSVLASLLRDLKRVGHLDPKAPMLKTAM